MPTKRGEGKAWVDANQGKHRCTCGCGGVILIQIHHHVRGIPRFIDGHGSRVKNSMQGRGGSRNPRWRGGRYTRRDGYVCVFCPGRGSSRYVLEHRLVMEEALGRRLRRDEFVHHVNGIKTDNRPENLELLSNAEHSRLHAKAGDIGFGRKFALEGGTPWVGEMHPNAKLTAAQVRLIRAAAKSGETFPVLAVRFQVTTECIAGIVRLRSRKKD